MEVTIIAALALAVVVLTLIAPAVSEALVNRCARRLPKELALRMQEEWIAELGYITTRPGKLAFALALALTRRRTFAAAAGEELMPQFHDRPARLAAIFGGWQMMLILPTIAFAVAANIASWYITDVYESQSTILVVAQQVPQEYVRSTVTTRIEDRLAATRQEIMSRKRLERIILDFNLYSEERKRGIMEDIVEQMRRDVQVELVRGDAFIVAYKSLDPRTAMRVTERLASMFIDASLRDREVLAEGTTQFLNAELDHRRETLIEYEVKRMRQDAAGEPGKTVRALEFEMLQADYRSLYNKKIEAQRSANLERRQIGETFKILDAARLPSRPISPNRPAIMLIGAFAGAAFGGMAIAGFFRRPKPALAA